MVRPVINEDLIREYCEKSDYEFPILKEIYNEILTNFNKGKDGIAHSFRREIISKEDISKVVEILKSNGFITALAEITNNPDNIDDFIIVTKW